MALQRATYTGKNDILDGYDAVTASVDEGCLYSVWVSQKDIAFQCVNRDREKARQMLESWLDSIETSENDDLFYLKFHPVGTRGFIDRKTTVICMFPIRVCDLGEAKLISGTESGRPDYRMYKLQDQLEKLPALIDDRIKQAIDLRLKELPENEPDQVDKVLGYIGQAANNPNIMSAIGQILSYFKPQYMAPRITGTPENVDTHPGQIENEKEPKTEPEQQQIEPVPVNETMLNDALDILEKHCRIDTDLMLLARLAENNPGLFDLMLMQLRSQ